VLLACQRVGFAALLRAAPGVLQILSFKPSRRDLFRGRQLCLLPIPSSPKTPSERPWLLPLKS
jgi:hypothetical protein